MKRLLLAAGAGHKAVGCRRSLSSAAERFAFEKRDILHGKNDKSSKGSWDAPIVDLLDRLNAEEEYCTLSSCSGRSYLWRWHSEDAADAGMAGTPTGTYWPSKKRSDQAFSRTWRFHVCHRFADLDLASLSHLADASRIHSDIEAQSFASAAELHEAAEEEPSKTGGAAEPITVAAPNVIWLKYEPLVCHVACRSWTSAARLIELSRPAFPRSSLLSWKKRHVVQVIGEDHLDMPVAEVFGDGDLAWFGGPRLRQFLQETVLHQKFAKNLLRTDQWRRSLFGDLG